MSKSDHHKDFLRLVSENRHRIFGYVFSLTGNRADSEDLLQESLITMWEKFDEFDPSTNSKLIFDNDILEKVAIQFEQDAVILDRRYEMLQQCLQKLNDRDREFILSRYQQGARVEKVARASGRKIQAAYKALARIRKRLYECVSFNLQRPQES
jgi:RNA polymerase sigma-70 factor (ECF subfamily)